MSFYPETDRASTWVALVMIGFMAVSVLVWVWGRSPRGAADSAATKAGPAAPAAPADAGQKPDAPQTAALTAGAQASALPASTQSKPADAPPPQFAPASQTSHAQATTPQAPPASSEPAWMSAARAEAQPAPAVSAPPAPTPAPVVVRPAPTPAPQQVRPPAEEGGVSASGLVRGLRVRGHRVHASVSGDGKSMTLSVSGSTLTRDACVDWLGGSRQELKAAGVRIVVVNNGQGSWTFML
jgi:hypothetical protein